MAASSDVLTNPSPGNPVPSVRDRLVPVMRDSTVWGWVATGLVALFAGVLRFFNLGTPGKIVFDETYYAADALALLVKGVEQVKIEGDGAADRLLGSANADIFRQCTQETMDQCAAFVVHPPMGKWMIAVGELLFGVNAFGWRFSAALVGTLSVLILARVARRMTRSTLLGCLAGLLLAMDGLHFVLSRFALLDIFLMFWVLAGFACMVIDRDRMRGKLVDWFESEHPASRNGPHLGWRPWRLAAGVCLGLAVATKWSGVFFMAAFIIMSLFWDAGARRAVGIRKPYSGTLLLDAPPAAGSMLVVPALTYIASYAGWFASSAGYGRSWDAATSTGNPLYFVYKSVSSWLTYQVEILNFHTGMAKPHDYQSEPWSWPFLQRPVAFQWDDKVPCGGGRCVQAVLGVGNPILWWGGLLALIACVVIYFVTRDWRAGAVVIAYLAGWVPWFYYAIADNRTMFIFYAIPMVPFMVLAIVICLGLIMGPATTGNVPVTATRRVGGAVLAGTFTLMVIAYFWWLYPILGSQVIPYDDWYARILFNSWI